MEYNVPEEMINKTTKCTFNYACLTEIGYKFCDKDYLVEDILFIKEDQIKNRCDYRYVFGDSFVCGCPTRIYLYMKYKN